METKLRAVGTTRRVRLSPDMSPEIYVRYANYDFATGDAEKRVKTLFAAISPKGWRYERTFQYLKQHQNEFRNCLAWLVEGGFVEVGSIGADWNGAVRDWRKHPAVKFLRLHGLAHAGVDLGCREFRDGFFLGLDFVPGKAKDPLDFVCWYLFSVLIRGDELVLGRCQFENCKKFFTASRDRRFCDDSCRAKYHQKRMGRAKLAAYMREYRSRPEVKLRAH